MLAQITKFPVNTPNEPPVSPESVRNAIDAANGERAHVRLMGIPSQFVPYPSESDPWARAEGIDLLAKLLAEFGASTVQTWLWQQAALMGVDLRHKEDGQ